MNTFQPDLIVEVTGACNRACNGCYAPNVVAKDAASLYETRPDLFIKLLTLNNAWNELREFPRVTAIRGGEPTLHPYLSAILIVASNKSREIYLETHGRWLLEENVGNYEKLIETIKDKNIIVKISFDKMHGMKQSEIKWITEYCLQNGINFRVAITEASIVEYLESKSQCFWVSPERFIFQQKAVSADELVKPTIGTINVRGEIKRTLTHKFELATAQGVGLL